jgi:hypothetical protein
MKGAASRVLLPSTILFLYNFTFPQDTLFACFMLVSSALKMEASAKIYKGSE